MMQTFCDKQQKDADKETIFREPSEKFNLVAEHKLQLGVPEHDLTSTTRSGIATLREHDHDAIAQRAAKQVTKWDIGIGSGIRGTDAFNTITDFVDLTAGSKR